MPTFYTRTGDDGYTGLLGEGRVPKYHPLTEAVGALDEAAAALGIARAACQAERSPELILTVQRALSHLMAEIASARENAARFRKIDASRVKWVEEQNKVTFGYLEKIPYRQQVKARLEKIYNYPKYSQPFRKGELFFFSKNDGLKNQAVLYVQKGLNGKPEVLLDPNTFSADGTARPGRANARQTIGGAARIKVSRRRTATGSA